MKKMDFDKLNAVVVRTESLYEDLGLPDNRTTIMLDLINANDCEELDLDVLLAMDHGNFGHDVIGIRRHMNRETGQLEDHFVPRCAAFQHRREA